MKSYLRLTYTLILVLIVNISNAEEIIISGATGVAKETAGYNKWTIFKDNVYKKTDGRLIIQPLISGELGSEENVLSSTRRGRVKIGNISSMVVTSLIPEAILLNTPYLFNSQEEAENLLDNILFKLYEPLLLEKGLIFLSWDDIGFHQVYGINPIIKPSDLKNVRFRVSTSLASKIIAESLGADIIPLPFTELISALETGLTVSGENAIILYARTGIAELAPNLTLTNHSFGVNFLFANKKWFNRLSVKDQNIIRKSYPSKGIGREMIKKEWNYDLKYASNIGFNIHTLNNEQMAAWKRALKPAIDKIVSLSGPKGKKIYQEVLSKRGIR